MDLLKCFRTAISEAVERERVSYPFPRSITIELTRAADHDPPPLMEITPAFCTKLTVSAFLCARDFEDAFLERAADDGHRLARFDGSY